MPKSPITTHILDTSLGRPASGVDLVLERKNDGTWVQVGTGTTNADGRVTDLMRPGTLTAGVYRIEFHIAPYFAAQQRDSFYPEATIVFEVKAVDEHYHVPLLLNPFGYSTYRGS